MSTRGGSAAEATGQYRRGTHMCADLYNLGAVMRDLAPALLGVAPGDGGGAWVEGQFPAGKPVVEIVGGRAAGKTTLLDALHAGYHRQLPTARVDCAEEHQRTDDATASPVTNLLFTVTYELARERQRGHRGRALTFPRLWPALAVITAWRPDTSRAGVVPPPGLAQAEEEVGEIVRDGNPNPQNRQVAQRWLNAVSGILGGLLPQVPGLAGVLQAATETFFADSHRNAQGTWWAGRMADEAGDAVQRLFALVRQFRRGGESQRAAEAHLLAALFADVDACYGPLTRRTQHPPLLLVDNVDIALRERILGPLVAQYTEFKNTRGPRAVLPVVVATSLGDGSAPDLVPVTDRTPWTRPDRCPPRTWLLRLGIPPATGNEICRMLDGVDRPRELPAVIARLSGGRTGSALVLAEAAAAQASRSQAPPALDGLLSLPYGDGPETVAQRLLAQWLPDPIVRRTTMTIAPALDEAAAAALLRAAGDAQGVDSVLQVRNLVVRTLHRDHWNDDRWDAEHGGPAFGTPAPLVADRALRTVLLHELGVRDSPPTWDQTHRQLTDHYNPGNVRSSESVRHDPAYLHHALALGRMDSLVVRALHHRYLRCTPAEWLRILNLVAAGASPPGGFPVDVLGDPAETPPCPACEERAGDRGVHSAIRQLLSTVWRLSSPSSGTPTGHRDVDVVRVEQALRRLCADYADHPEAGAAYNAYVDALAERGWLDALVNGAQAPHLPVVERQGT